MKNIVYLIIIFNSFIFFLSSCKSNIKEENAEVKERRVDTIDILKNLINSAAEEIISEQKKLNQPKIEITKETGKDNYCYLDSLYFLGNDIIVSVDFVQWIDDENSPSGYDIINENPKLRYFIVNENTNFYVNTSASSVIQDLNFNLNKLINDFSSYKKDRFWVIDIDDGLITTFKEIYLP